MISFEEQVANVRQHLAAIYERESNWKEAASVLVGIPLETGQKYLFVIIVLFRFTVIITLIYILENILLIINWKPIWKSLIYTWKMMIQC